VSEQRQPRVLHIGKYLPPVPGGIETYLGDLLRVSMRHGLEVGAVVHGKKGYPDPNPADFGGAKIYTVPTCGQVLYAPVAPMFPWVLRKAIRDFKPDILHMHVPNTSVFCALFIPEALKIPWVLHWHADVDVGKMSLAMRVAYSVYQPLETALLRKSKLIIATSEEYLAASKPLLPWQDKCEVIPLAIDPERMGTPTETDIAAAARLWPRPNEARFLAVGRLTYYKGYDALIRGFAQSAFGSLVIVGDGECRQPLESLIIELNMRDRVRLVGTLPTITLAGCFSATDFFCMTSVDRSEAFGLVLLEAAYFGCGLLAFEIPGSGVGSVVRKLGGDVKPASTSVTALWNSHAFRRSTRVASPRGVDLFLWSVSDIHSWKSRYERLSKLRAH
jgi:glycosyltransferase involved in cell wall biosynthesis